MEARYRNPGTWRPRAWPPGPRAAGGSADNSASPTGTTADAERAPNGRGHGRTGSLTSENQSFFRYLALSSGGICLGDHLARGHRRCGPRTPLQPEKGGRRQAWRHRFKGCPRIGPNGAPPGTDPGRATGSRERANRYRCCAGPDHGGCRPGHAAGAGNEATVIGATPIGSELRPMDRRIGADRHTAGCRPGHTGRP